MADFSKVKRHQLKVHPDADAQLGELVRALERIADGVESIVETFDALIVKDAAGDDAVRTVSS